LGEPGDEQISKHPLYEFGLRSYGFFRVEEGRVPDLTTAAAGLQKRWMVTFHDEMLDVTADDAQFDSVQSRAPHEVIKSIAESRQSGRRLLY
jgi:hypothetical protein